MTAPVHARADADDAPEETAACQQPDLGWRLAATSPILGSQVGRHVGTAVVSDGRAGFLVFGPYRRLTAGRWRAVVEGSIEPGAGCVRIDVASGMGDVVHAAVEVRGPTTRVEFEFRLDASAQDVEVRVWTHESSIVRVDAIAVEDHRWHRERPATVTSSGSEPAGAPAPAVDREPRVGRRPRPGRPAAPRRPDSTFSIVIATDGRAPALAELLDSLPFLAGPPCEVCVVTGPTADGVADVLAGWRGRIKTAANPLRNLSISRNIGIAMAAGDVVAFLDDDAIPDADWLVELAAAFRDPTLTCAGGLNRDRSGTVLQRGHAVADRMGNTRGDRTEPADSLCVPFAAEFPFTQGTNMAVRRTDLEAVRGFDEEYDFFLDDTDLCCRLVDAGRVVRQLPDAFVLHRSLPSGIRTPDGVTHSLRSVLKSKLYFSLVNNVGHHTTDEALADFDAFVVRQEQHLRRAAAAAADGSRWLDRFPTDVVRARRIGLARGQSGLRRLMSPGLRTRHRGVFLPLPRQRAADRTACPVRTVLADRTGSTPPHASGPGGLSGVRDQLRRTWAGLLPSGTRVALAVYPDHWNVGDAAIWWGTRSLLASLGVAVAYGCDPWSYDPDDLVRSVPRGPILLLGGGNFGDVYGREQSLRTRVITDFPDRPIIQLPQSIWFRSPEARDAMACLLAGHPNTTLLLRDERSLAFARTHFPVPAIVCPDAALAIDLPDVPRPADVPVVALWRRDVESDVPPPPLPAGSIVADWHDGLVAARGSMAVRFFRTVVGHPPTDERACPTARRAAWRFAPSLWDAVARERTLHGCRLLARGRVVITNRLHAHLLCTLLGIPHVVCDTVNGKLAASLDTWEQGDVPVRLAASPTEAAAMAASLAATSCHAFSRAA